MFCEPCLDKKLIGEAGDPGTPEAALSCPDCSQVTKVNIQQLYYLKYHNLYLEYSNFNC